MSEPNLPDDNQLVWVRTDLNKEWFHCMKFDLTGWMLGWYSGSKWHLLVDTDKNSKVTAWKVIHWKNINIGNRRGTDDR